MALISCPECGGKVSDKASACIHCGYPLQKNKEIREQNLIEEILTDSKWMNRNGRISFWNKHVSGWIIDGFEKKYFSGSADYYEPNHCIALSGKGIEGDQIDFESNGKIIHPLMFSLPGSFYRVTDEEYDKKYDEEDDEEDDDYYF